MQMHRVVSTIGLGLSCVAMLSGCQGLATHREGSELTQAIEAIRQAQVESRTGSVKGSLFLGLIGANLPLQDWPVQLIPLTPSLDAAIRNAQKAFVGNGRRPLSPAELLRARHLIGRQITALQRMGHQELIFAVKTDKTDKPVFTFPSVPEGRWLLLSHLKSEVSLLLWAVPVTVRAAQETLQTLNDQTIWIEGFLAPTEERQPPRNPQP